MNAQTQSSFNQVEMVYGGAASASAAYCYDSSTRGSSTREKSKPTPPTCSSSVGSESDVEEAPTRQQHGEPNKTDKAYNKGNESRQTVAAIPFAGRLPRVVALVVGLVIFAATAGALCLWIGHHPNLGLQNSQSGNATEEYLEAISLTELAQHADPLNDCWLAIHGFVWDLTDYAPDHPGGADYITNFCGQDATAVYADQHPMELLDLVADTKVGKFSSFVASSTASPSPAPVDQKEQEPKATTDVPAASAVSSPTTAPCFSLTDVQQHATRDDCWYMLFGEVWDLTDYIDKHPGGAQRVYDYCGGGTLTEEAYSREHNPNLLWQKVSQHYLGIACTER